jgi:hypothetical protein
MSSIIDLNERARQACALYIYGHISPDEAIAWAGYTYLDPEAEFIVKPNLPFNMELCWNGDVVIRKRWQRRVR